MGACYYAYNEKEKKYFKPPKHKDKGYDLGDKAYQIYQPWNPFPNMLLMMNVYTTDIFDEDYWKLGSDEAITSPGNLDDYEDITEQVYKKYLYHTVHD